MLVLSKKAQNDFRRAASKWDDAKLKKHYDDMASVIAGHKGDKLTKRVATAVDRCNLTFAIMLDRKAPSL